MLLMLLSACGPAANNNGEETSENATTAEKVTGEPTDDGVTTDEPTATEVATTEAATTEEEFTTELSTTQTISTTEEASTDAPSEDLPPVKKDMKILMIGNSFCYYFVEELYAIAAADGYDLTVANLYYSGCSVQRHYVNGILNGEAIYEFYVTNKDGRTTIASSSNKTTFDDALAYDDWDVISIQQHFYPDLALSAQNSVNYTKTYAKNIYNHIKKENPTAELYWHQTWAYQVGYGVAENYVSAPKVDTAIDSVAAQTTTYNNIKAASQTIAKENNVKLIPSGDAWQIARADSRVGDNMCARIDINGNKGDYYHDGDIGGGQYLNACVWYEVLTRESCVGNTWRPTYTLSEEKIAGIQAAAHAAVAAVYGENYAK